MLLFQCLIVAVEANDMKRKELIALSLSIVIIGAAVAYVIIKNPFAQTRTWHLSGPPLSGEGSQDTEPFNMSNQWRVSWSIESRTTNLFIVAVYAGPGYADPPVAEADESDTGAVQGGLIMYYTGTFVIRVVAAQDTQWTLRIEEPD